MLLNNKTWISLLPLGILAVIVWRLAGPEASAPSEPAAAPALKDVKKEPAPAAAAVSEDLLKEYELFSFDAVFKIPAGPRGLEHTEKALSLAGRKVRMEGSMVKHSHADPRVFLLAPQPLTLYQQEFGLADDLPPSAAHVILPEQPGMAPVWTPARMIVCGVLETGARQEADGRISHLRLQAEHLVSAADRTPLDVQRPLALQRDRVASASASAAHAPAAGAGVEAGAASAR